MRVSEMLLKKKHPKFVVPNLGAKHRARVKDRWRSQRGIDNKKKLKKSGYGKMPSIGYKNPDVVRFKERSGMLKIIVHNSEELSAIKEKELYEVVFAHDLSKKKRMELQRIADARGIKVANRVKI